MGLRRLTGADPRYFWVLCLCASLSVAGIFVAAAVDRSADGGRGGAVAVAVSFGLLFLGRGFEKYPFEVLKSIFEEKWIDPAIVSDRERFEYHETLIRSMYETIVSSRAMGNYGMLSQNAYLAISSFIGTIAWGFGDWAACGLRLLVHCVCSK